ncbi:periplasmic chaperone for outer membrane proteins SurA [Thiohalospira halophila DSM 15071]|uniref:Chaperone SurA n=2 Tax=Thiohalospira halophila TaxID=381300 RepID=A0A1I1TVB2_9GAMM|nr:periplasmic chaperone for outer membrane proteins SurA [Thiohalospira halophila DSM 15071]
MYRILAPLLAILMALALSAPAAAETLERIVAVVNDEAVLASELEREMRTVRQQLQQRNIRPPSQEALEKQVLDRLITQRLQLQMAERTRIRVDDVTLNRALQDIASRNNLSLEQFRNVLERDGIDYAAFREDIRDEITISRLQQRQVQQQVQVTEEEVENHLDNLRARGALDEEYRLRHILVAVPEAASPDEVEAAREEAASLREQLVDEGADFARLATRESDGQNALEGGDLGWRRGGRLPETLAESLQGLEAGGISEVVRTPSGFHLLQLEERRTTGGETEEQTRARHILLQGDNARSRLQRLRRQIENGADFAELAREHSEDPGSAERGGDLGWVGSGALVSEFENVMDGLNPGQVSQPFETQFGWHIVRVEDRRRQAAGLESRRNEARQLIRQRKSEETIDRWLRQLRAEAYIERRLGE